MDIQANPLQGWVTVLVVLAICLGVGAIAGICVGKYLVKRKKPGYKPLLSAKEKIVYASCTVIGIGLIMFGMFFDFSKFTNTQNPDITYISEAGEAGGGADRPLAVPKASPRMR